MLKSDGVMIRNCWHQRGKRPSFIIDVCSTETISSFIDLATPLLLSVSAALDDYLLCPKACGGGQSHGPLTRSLTTYMVGLEAGCYQRLSSCVLENTCYGAACIGSPTLQVQHRKGTSSKCKSVRGTKMFEAKIPSYHVKVDKSVYFEAVEVWKCKDRVPTSFAQHGYYF